MANREAAHHTVDLYPYLIPYLGIWDKDDEAFNPCDTVPFTGDILDLHVILAANSHWGRRSRATRKSFLTSKQFFTVLSEKLHRVFAHS